MAKLAEMTAKWSAKDGTSLGAKQATTDVTIYNDEASRLKRDAEGCLAEAKRLAQKK